MLVPKPRPLHVPLLPLPPDGSVAGPPRHHSSSPGPQLLLVLRQPVRALPAQREFPQTLQQVRVIEVLLPETVMLPNQIPALPQRIETDDTVLKHLTNNKVGKFPL